MVDDGPSSPWRLTAAAGETGTSNSDDEYPDLPRWLARFVWLDRSLGRLGYDASEYDRWEFWMAAARLGDERHEPIIRGSRSLRLPSDETPKAPTGRSSVTRWEGEDPSIRERIRRGRERLRRRGRRGDEEEP